VLLYSVVVKRVLPVLVVVGLLACTASASAMSYRPAGITAADSPLEAATSLVEQRPDLVGGASAARIDISSEVPGAAGTTVVRFDQSVRGVPVLGGDVVVAVDEANRVVAADGGSLSGALPSLRPAISAPQAIAIATQGMTGSDIRTGTPTLALYDPALVGRPGAARTTLVWSVHIEQGTAIRRDVYVDAQQGFVVARADEVETALNRTVCDGSNVRLVAVPCGGTDVVRTEHGPTGSPEVERAFGNAGLTYAFYLGLGRDSIDGAGMTLASTVRYCPSLPDSCPYENAFWNGEQMVYGDGFATADDVVAHELTHGVTDYTSHLFYWYQSGAINEALSDIMGEFVDLRNPSAAVLPNVAANQWLMGEDLQIGNCIVRTYHVFRDMQNPPNCGDPDKVSSPNYWATAGDSGGVHTNSGIVNKTAYLIAAGDTFNGRTVTGIGIAKSATLWYQTELLLRSGSSFADLAATLHQACATLVGNNGFTTDDCAQVDTAAATTELTTTPSGSTTPAVACNSGTQTNLFADSFENGANGAWTKDNAVSGTPGGEWWYSSETNPFSADMRYASAGVNNVWGNDPPGVSDTRFAMASGVGLPAGAYLRFAHADGFETSLSTNVAGGVVEYSLDGGAWTDAGSLPMVNGYTGTLAIGQSNPLGGQQAFVGYSKGYTATRVDLSSLAGHAVRFRFRIATGTDGSSNGDYGWYIDDVAIYTCGIPAASSPAASPPASMAPAAAIVKTPPTSGTWTTNAATDTVQVLFVRAKGTTYAIKGRRNGATQYGSCRAIGTRVRCSIKAPTGTWRVMVTPTVNGTVGKAIIQTVRT